MSDLIKCSKFYPLQIVVDFREPPVMKRLLREKKNILVFEEKLNEGDYRLDNELLVERKTIPDFCSSIKDGRLFKQVSRLVNSKIKSCMILEGKTKDFKKTGFKKETLQAIMVSISLAFKLPILTSKNEEETLSIMLQCYKQLTNDKLSDFRYVPRIKPRFSKTNSLFKHQVHILQGFPGIGADRAAVLINHYGSLKKIFTASETDLNKLHGIGDTTIKKMKMILEVDSLQKL